MCKRNNSALFFLCSLIEQIGRDLNRKRGDVVKQIGKQQLQKFYDRADVLHCEPIEKVSDDIIGEFQLHSGEFNNVKDAKYQVPDVWTSGKVYARLIEDTSSEENVLDVLFEVFTSWIDERISDYNSAFYYQPRDYIAACWNDGAVIDG